MKKVNPKGFIKTLLIISVIFGGIYYFFGIQQNSCSTNYISIATCPFEIIFMKLFGRTPDFSEQIALLVIFGASLLFFLRSKIKSQKIADLTKKSSQRSKLKDMFKEITQGNSNQDDEHSNKKSNVKEIKFDQKELK